MRSLPTKMVKNQYCAGGEIAVILHSDFKTILYEPEKKIRMGVPFGRHGTVYQCVSALSDRAHNGGIGLAADGFGVCHHSPFQEPVTY